MEALDVSNKYGTIHKVRRNFESGVIFVYVTWRVVSVVQNIGDVFESKRIGAVDTGVLPVHLDIFRVEINLTHNTGDNLGISVRLVK